MANFPYIIVVTLVLLYFQIKKRKAAESAQRIDSQKRREWEARDESNHGNARTESTEEHSKRGN